MALLDDRERHLLLGIVVGVGAVWLGRDLMAPFSKLVRPVAKAGMKAGLEAAERGKEALARLGEHLEDLAAEVQAEREVEELNRTAGHATAPEDRPSGGNGDASR